MMNRMTYTGSLLAVVLGGYGGAAYGQAEPQQSSQQRSSQAAQQGAEQGAQQSQQSVQHEQNAQHGQQSTQHGQQSTQQGGQSAQHAQQQGQAQQGQPQQSEQRQREAGRPPPAAVPAEPATIDETQVAELVGKTVKSAEGEEIGEVSGIARSLSDQKLHALVDVGGFLGIGERTVTIPLDQARIDQQSNLVTQMTREQLEQMQEYDPQQYAELEQEGDDERLLR